MALKDKVKDLASRKVEEISEAQETKPTSQTKPTLAVGMSRIDEDEKGGNMIKSVTRMSVKFGARRDV